MGERHSGDGRRRQRKPTRGPAFEMTIFRDGASAMVRAWRRMPRAPSKQTRPSVGIPFGRVFLQKSRVSHFETPNPVLASGRGVPDKRRTSQESPLDGPPSGGFLFGLRHRKKWRSLPFRDCLQRAAQFFRSGMALDRHRDTVEQLLADFLENFRAVAVADSIKGFPDRLLYFEKFDDVFQLATAEDSIADSRQIAAGVEKIQVVRVVPLDRFQTRFAKRLDDGFALGFRADLCWL
jgi:hypothetical protein